MRESVIELHLHRQVVAAGGITRKWVSPGRRGVPDRIVIWPGKKGARVHFVETKAPGRTARPSQIREHNRLMLLGCVVLVLDTKEKVNTYVENEK